MAALNNPERAWARPAALTGFDVSEIERRIGPVQGRIELLSGGLANLNLHVAGHGVLRIYRSELGRPRKEAQLLSLPWRQLRVPRVLREGADFLLLEHVPHSALQDGEPQGQAVGSALAEIHQARSYAQAGLLDDELSLAQPFGPELEVMETVATEQLRRTSLAELGPQLARCLATARASQAQLARPCVLLHSDFKVSNLHWADEQRLLVLDWETAYAGPALLDIGQLLRWDPPEAFLLGFMRGYQAGGGLLPLDWRQQAQALDAINLVFLLGGSEPGSLRAQEVEARLRRTLTAAGA